MTRPVGLRVNNRGLHADTKKTSQTSVGVAGKDEARRSCIKKFPLLQVWIDVFDVATLPVLSGSEGGLKILKLKCFGVNVDGKFPSAIKNGVSVFVGMEENSSLNDEGLGIERVMEVQQMGLIVSEPRFRIDDEQMFCETQSWLISSKFTVVLF